MYRIEISIIFLYNAITIYNNLDILEKVSEMFANKLVSDSYPF